jgi:hypothetical protein
MRPSAKSRHATDFALDGLPNTIDGPSRGARMPEGHQIDVARRLVTSRAWGVFSTAEFLACRASSGAPSTEQRPTA